MSKSQALPLPFLQILLVIDFSKVERFLWLACSKSFAGAFCLLFVLFVGKSIHSAIQLLLKVVCKKMKILDVKNMAQKLSFNSFEKKLRESME